MGSVHRPGIPAESMMTTELVPKSRLVEAKQKRQEASKDALLLRNRIALLKAEEEKAWKKIEQTRRRAAELLKLREDTTRTQAELREHALLAEQELQASIKAKRELVQSIDSLQKKKETADQLTEARRQEAKQLKEEKQHWKKMTDQKKHDERLEAMRRKEEIVLQKELLKTKKMLQRQEIERITRERAMDKLRAEQESARRHEADVAEMERVELEMIQRLRNTQHLQKQAFEELEAALSGTASDATAGSPFKDPQRPQ